MALTSLRIEESIQIAAAPEIVWKFLADPRSWQHWWPGCREAETRDRKPLHDGSLFSVALHLGWITFAVHRPGRGRDRPAVAALGRQRGRLLGAPRLPSRRPAERHVRPPARELLGTGRAPLPAGALRRRHPADVPAEPEGLEADGRALGADRGLLAQRKPRRSSRANSFQVASSNRQTMTRWSLVPPCR